jgi:hypothetical protein
MSKNASAAASRSFLDGPLQILLITVLLAMTWSMTGIPKLMAGGPPQGFIDTFGKTFLGTFPGVTVAFASIMILEVAAAALAVGSLARLEFRAGASKLLLKGALALSTLLFIQLGFGQRLVQGHDDAHKLFMYAAATLVMWYLVEQWSRDGSQDPAG